MEAVFAWQKNDKANGVVKTSTIRMVGFGNIDIYDKGCRRELGVVLQQENVL